jgi:hypothetical protein
MIRQLLHLGLLFLLLLLNVDLTIVRQEPVKLMDELGLSV